MSDLSYHIISFLIDECMGSFVITYVGQEAVRSGGSSAFLPNTELIARTTERNRDKAAFILKIEDMVKESVGELMLEILYRRTICFIYLHKLESTVDCH